MEASKAKLPRSIWGNDDEELASPTLPHSKEVKIIYPQQKHNGKPKKNFGITYLTRCWFYHDFIHINRFGAIGGEELDFLVLYVGHAVRPNGLPFNISKQPEDRPANVRGKSN